MSVAVELIGFSLRADGRAVSASLPSGRVIALCGRAGAGKTQFLDMLVGRRQPGSGRLRLFGSTFFYDGAPVPRRLSPLALAKRFGGKASADRMTEVLTRLGLWEDRERPIEVLSSSQRRAALLVPSLMSDEDNVLTDGGFDGLDPVVRESAFSYVRQRAQIGQTWLIATHDLGLAVQADDLIVLRLGSVAYCGSVEAFATDREPVVIDVQTANVPSVRALVEPFAIDVEERATGLRFRARKGQSLAARLLLQGYGDVRIVTVRQPRVEDQILGAL